MHKKLIWLLALLCVGWNTPRHYRHHMSLYYTGSPIPTVTWATKPGVGYHIVPGANENGIVLVNGSQNITLSTTPVTVVAQGSSILFEYPNLIPAGSVYAGGVFSLTYLQSYTGYNLVWGANEYGLGNLGGIPRNPFNPGAGQVTYFSTPQGTVYTQLSTVSSTNVTAAVYLAQQNVVFTGRVYPTTAIPFTPQKFVVYQGQVWCRDTAGNFYQLGGASNQEYDNCGLSFTIPYLSAQTPGTRKQWTAIDAAFEGTWAIGFSSDYLTDAYKNIFNGTQSTFQYGRIALYRHSTHFSLNAVESSTGYARFANALVYYNEEDQKGAP